MKKILFIDRDGTIIIEPPNTYQVDSLHELRFVPGVITWLGKIARELQYELVMVTNQDGLGTESFPEDNFWDAHNRMLEILAGEGILFHEVLIDRTFAHERAETRKPGIGMLRHYLAEDVDILNSYVIGDRMTDVQLAHNLGCKSIFLQGGNWTTTPGPAASHTTESWEQIYTILRGIRRSAEVIRSTSETNVQIYIDLDGVGNGTINTGIGFLDHMLQQVAKHSGMDLRITTRGDLQVDEHHTIEDTALAFGEAFAKALGDKAGIERYGFVLPMDDALATIALDLGGRSWLEWDVEFRREKIGDMPTEMFAHFFRSFCEAAKCNLNIKAMGTNEHHKIEAIFKGFARSIRSAIRRDDRNPIISSTKGIL